MTTFGDTIVLKMSDFASSNMSLNECQYILDNQLMLRKIGEWLEENPDQRESLEEKLLEVDVSNRSRSLIHKMTHEIQHLYKQL